MATLRSQTEIPPANDETSPWIISSARKRPGPTPLTEEPGRVSVPLGGGSIIRAEEDRPRRGPERPVRAEGCPDPAAYQPGWAEDCPDQAEDRPGWAEDYPGRAADRPGRAEDCPDRAADRLEREAARPFGADYQCTYSEDNP